MEYKPGRGNIVPDALSRIDHRNNSPDLGDLTSLIVTD